MFYGSNTLKRKKKKKKEKKNILHESCLMKDFVEEENVIAIFNVGELRLSLLYVGRIEISITRKWHWRRLKGRLSRN